MDRRDFLKLTAAAGIAATTVPWGAREASAVSYDTGPLYLFLLANGGWDTTLLCDPKGVNGINNSYQAGEILTAGNINYAPLVGNQAFFETYYRDLLVINGMDMASASHPGGIRYAWSGRIESDDYPAFGAVAAGLLAPQVPLSFMSMGGYAGTGNLVALSRLYDNLATIGQLTGADYIGGNRTRAYYRTSVRGEIDRALAAEHTARLANQHLPFNRLGMSNLENARLSADSLARLDAALPAALSGSRLDGRMQIVMAAFKAGISVSATVSSTANFDSHADNDNLQTQNMPVVVTAIDTAMKEAARLGLSDRVVIVVGSEFARTPGYNPGNGKDHWGVGSMLIMGAGIRGNRVIGGTDDHQKALKIDPSTLAISSAANAITLRPEHVHLALRKHAGVDGNVALNRFPLPGEHLNLFG